MNQIDRIRGFAVADLLTGIATLSLFGVLALPVIQELREASRNAQCQARIGELANDASAYYDANGRLPSFLGARGAVAWSDYLDSSSPNYWVRQQASSAMANGIRASGRLEQITGSSEPIDVRFWDFDQPLPTGLSAGSLSGFNTLARLQTEIFRCPTVQVFRPVVRYDQSNQPVTLGSPIDPANNYIGQFGDTDVDQDLGVTNYVSCFGASNGSSPGQRGLLRAFRGMILSREVVTYDDVTNADGLANSIMYGENIGWERRDFDTCIRYVSLWNLWVGGSGARGRGAVDFMADPPLSSEPTKNYPNGGDPDGTILGRIGFSNSTGFGSHHRDGVNFVFGDGHVELIPRDVDWRVLYAKFGSFDGTDNGF